MAESAVTRRTPYHELPEWLTPEELAHYLSVSRNSAYELIRSGAVPSKRFGRLLRVPRAALEAR